MHPVETSMSPRMKRSQSPLAIRSTTGLLERWTHVGGYGFYTAVGESLKYSLEAQSGWGQQKRCRMGSREGRALFCTFRFGHHGFFYGLGKRAAAAEFDFKRSGRGLHCERTKSTFAFNH